VRHPFAEQELAELERLGRRRSLRAIDGAQGRSLVVDGARVVNFSANDYLGLAAHPELARASAQAASRLGTGAGASRLIAGNQEPHRRLERALAGHFRYPAARLFNSGYHANLGVLQGLAGPADALFSDQLNHASLIDGCRLSRAAVHVYPHADVAALDRLLATHGRGARRRLVVSDALFSMDGDAAPVAELAACCRDHDALLVLDEAHAVGCLGPAGRGVAAAAGIQPDVLVGTLGKAFGSFGAFALSSESVVELLGNRARSFVFTTALPPAVVTASERALELIAGAPGDPLREALVNNVHRLAGALRSLGLVPNRQQFQHIIPIVVGDDRLAMAASEALLGDGFYVQGIRPPTVPAGTARLRIAVAANHTDSDIDGLVGSLARLARAGALGQGEAA
jgi:8-amino-7-oxononanoate synthase